MKTYRVNLGVDLKANSLDDIQEVVFKLRKLVSQAAHGKATPVDVSILGCEEVKPSQE